MIEIHAAVRRAIASVARVPEAELVIVDSWRNYRDQCETFVLDGNQRVDVSDHVMRRLVPPPSNPFVEGLTEMALFFHEREKRAARAAAAERRDIEEFGFG